MLYAPCWPNGWAIARDWCQKEKIIEDAGRADLKAARCNYDNDLLSTMHVFRRLPSWGNDLRIGVDDSRTVIASIGARRETWN